MHKSRVNLLYPLLASIVMLHSPTFVSVFGGDGEVFWKRFMALECLLILSCSTEGVFDFLSSEGVFDFFSSCLSRPIFLSSLTSPWTIKDFELVRRVSSLSSWLFAPLCSLLILVVFPWMWPCPSCLASHLSLNRSQYEFSFVYQSNLINLNIPYS